ncbi:hypothetical protein RFN28_30460 [Mesorhizobium sp. VK24D]|uniref:Uncharacterized protein n=1 Tax=Mesorhizobium album TaxID=3072314 RepID=A0ABU4Y7Q7_9HYPH|nr:hypothetical protein [Mesorhizobium sp. VK24D]MDX8482751.1 hypothetical protein [Mesorhizobium sp. VK24D]
MRKILLTAAIILISALPAVAQTADQPLDQQLKDCQARPDANGQQQGQKPQAGKNELSETLDKCGGVLLPPPTGDKNATVPPANNSPMPIIKPGELSPQTAK